MSYLQQAIDLLSKAFSFAKQIVLVLFIRKAAQTEVHHDVFKRLNEIKTKQIATAAQPPRRWTALLERMRSDKL